LNNKKPQARRYGEGAAEQTVLSARRTAP